MILTYNEGDKFIHAESFKAAISHVVHNEFTGETKNIGDWFCNMLSDFVDAFPPAPVKLIEDDKTEETP